MKICFALLVDNKLHNYARKIAFDIDKKHNTGFIAAKLPQHVTLGEVIDIDNLDEAEKYFDILAKSINPFEIDVTKIDLKVFGDDNDGFGVLWMEVKESNLLRALHNRIYKEISAFPWRADRTSGDGIYYFHSTIALGQQPAKIYKEAYNNIENKELSYTFQVKEISLFCSPDDENKMGTYITYKTLPLGEKP